jgi:phospholipid/cholesterol/gamma-HCH transport system substrate-binding protein
MSFHERNPVVIGVIAVLVMAAITVAGLSIQGSQLRGGYMLTAQFEDASGLRPGDDVFVAGVRAGAVKSVDIVKDHVEVVLSVNGHELPSETRAKIAVRTLVGSRGIELVAQGPYDEVLADGDVIPMERTDIPIDAPEFGDVSEELLADTDAEALNELLVSLTDVTRGQREEIGALIDGGNRVTKVITEQERDIRSLLNSLSSVSTALNSQSDDIITIIDDFGSTLRTLRARRAELQRFFRETNTTAASAADLVGREKEELDSILEDVHEVTEVLSTNQMALAEALAYAGDSIVGFSSVGYAGQVPVPWGHIFATSAGPIGVDIVAGCGGLIDQRLDDILGPDPRTCVEQANDTFPDNPGGTWPPQNKGSNSSGGAAQPPAPRAPSPSTPAQSQDQRMGLEAILQRQLSAGGQS